MRKFNFLKATNSNFSLLLIVFAISFLSSCKSEYDQLVRAELKSGIQKDSLLFNMFLGETLADFHSKCWELNKQKIVSQGSGNKYARYVEPIDSSNEKYLRKQMDFYGVFDDQGVMQGMEMVFSYLAWAPWNEQTQSQALIEDLKKDFVARYPGNDFITVNLKKVDEKTYVKVDGNMQILMFTKGAKEVIVRMEDLNYKLNL